MTLLECLDTTHFTTTFTDISFSILQHCLTVMKMNLNTKASYCRPVHVNVFNLRILSGNAVMIIRSTAIAWSNFYWRYMAEYMLATS